MLTARLRTCKTSSTWLEGWQNGGAEEGCGTPVAPHDGGGSATYTYDADTGMLTIDGLGGHLGLPKAVNGGELGNACQYLTQLPIKLII